VSTNDLDSGFHRSDDFLRVPQNSKIWPLAFNLCPISYELSAIGSFTSSEAVLKGEARSSLPNASLFLSFSLCPSAFVL
jgi:hypothetical protein